LALSEKTRLEGPAAAERAQATGTLLGRYEIIQETGRGGMGVVYKARDPSLKRVVALKVLKSDDVGRAILDRFQREALAVARLNHPNIVKLYEAGNAGQTHYVAMEYVEGKSLGAARKDLTEMQVVQVLEDAARALHYAHTQGVIHRDMKPGNILIEEGTQRTLVVDFGLARLESEEKDLTRSGSPMGTPAYMAPEQVKGKRGSIGPRTDVYGLGATMYHMLTGRTPFVGENVVELYHKICESDPEGLRRVKPQVAWELEAVVMRAMEKERQSSTAT
jgi:serine/threonine-protein kinase